MAYNYLFKFIIVGNASVGKSCIASRFQNNQYSSNYEVTIGVEFYTKTINILSNNKEYTVKIQIWDTAGQEAYRSLIRSYYRNASCCLLVFDISDRKSFLSLHRWIESVRINSNQYLIFTLIGNKSDRNIHRQVSIDEAMKFASDNNMEYIETSALNSRNIENAFYSTSKKLLDNIIVGNIPIIGNDAIKKGIQLNNNNRIIYKNDDSCCF